MSAPESPHQEIRAAVAHSLPVAHRIGVFGGSFDPPHVAHRALAEAALAQLDLDVLHILPTGQAWHKARPLSLAAHRLAMCELAFGDLLRVRIDPRETLREGPSYTADTLKELANEYPGAQLYLVLGADQLLAFKTWKRWAQVLEMATLAVAQRPVAALTDQPGVVDAADFSAVDLPFFSLSMSLHPISATAVRARVSTSNGQSEDFGRLVSKSVASYISTYSLYQDLT
ncbi:MAG: nicotinate (nicotinamide) nucleotide adenylyltransferase [Hydrogenophaga sp.]